MSDMRTRNNSIAERLWYVVFEAIQAGVTVEEFRRECAACWEEAHRDQAEASRREWLRGAEGR
jgi:hypothetical protein